MYRKEEELVKSKIVKIALLITTAIVTKKALDGIN